MLPSPFIIKVLSNTSTAIHLFPSLMQPYMFNLSMSSSSSSSPSVRNPYSHTSSSKKNSDFEYLGVKCKCDIVAPCREAWKEGTLDPGRRFFGCSQYKDPSKKYNFFLWADPPYPERARDMIKDLKAKLRKKDDDFNNTRIDVNFVERKMYVLHEEVCNLRKKNKEAATMLKKMEKEAWILKRLLVVVILIVFWLMM